MIVYKKKIVEKSTIFFCSLKHNGYSLVFYLVALSVFIISSSNNDKIY